MVVITLHDIMFIIAVVYCILFMSWFKWTNRRNIK